MTITSLVDNESIESAQQFLIEQGLASEGEPSRWTPLTGGVSSLLWRVDLGKRTVCVKGALHQLKVADTWLAPVTRNTVEWNWLEYASSVAPLNVPTPLAHDENRGVFAMSFLPPEHHQVWKERLIEGVFDSAEAAAVGKLIGALHGASAGDAKLAHTFATDDNFESLRIEPYLRSTARKHQDLSSHFARIIEQTTGTRRAVVHGDVSPKNILIGPSGPVLLDAECAWYGDPAFDLAFVVNHFVLKAAAIGTSDNVSRLLESVYALIDAYSKKVTWEPIRAVIERAALLFPALMLARVDGVSPVEYLTGDQMAATREAARRLLRAAGGDLKDVVIEALIILVDRFESDGAF